MTRASGMGWADDVVRSVLPGGGMPAGLVFSDQADWVGVAANPGSGRGGGRRDVNRLIRELARRGLRARVAWTLDERQGLVAEAASDPSCRCLVAAGGDGTVGAL